MNYSQVLNELETLVNETFTLWEHNRVGFQWRHYTWNHTMRVRATSMELGRREGGDVKLLEVAGTLHDITKRYDGEFKTDKEGKRLFSPDGLWLNETLTPAGQNIVTELYDKHNLHGKVHHESGAVITENVLAMYDFEPAFVEAATAVVFAHLKPTNLYRGELETTLQQSRKPDPLRCRHYGSERRLYRFFPKHSHPRLFRTSTRKLRLRRLCAEPAALD